MKYSCRSVSSVFSMSCVRAYLVIILSMSNDSAILLLLLSWRILSLFVFKHLVPID